MITSLNINILDKYCNSDLVAFKKNDGYLYGLFIGVMIFLFSVSQCLAFEATLAERIILDPMYGGLEEGPIGDNNLKGKDITLDISSNIAKLLKEEGYDVILTRNADITISSKERSLIAKRNHGDVFISIGINASADNKVSGIETHILEYQILDTTNNSDSADKKTTRQIVNDLSLKDNVINNKHLARCLSEIVSRDLNIKNLGAKSADFEILFNLNIPSVIMLINFISNKEVAENLSTSAYRVKIANSVTRAIIKYFKGGP
ncbi:MAG: N-acetylmuramoyl-L-alanine amidase family protein [Thermodesulfovibrionales bacterium]